MSKEFSPDMAGKYIPEPIKAVGDSLEAALNGENTSEQNAAGGGGQKNTTIKDTGMNAWSETYGNTTYNYEKAPMDWNNIKAHGMAVNDGKDAKENEKGNWVFPNADGSVMADQVQQPTTMGDTTHNPAHGLYKKDKYLAGKTVTGKDDNAHPAFEDLVEKNQAGQKVTMIQGTLQKPNVINDFAGGLFINNTVTDQDIHQYNIGDCYFLAALLQIVKYDPKKIMDMMKVMGDQVKTTFFHKNGNSWEPVTIVTKMEFLKRDQVYSNSPQSMATMGARVRINYNPKTCEWHSSIAGSTLKIDKKRLYEAALWVNCMEQAYMLFSQKYTIYGGGTKDSERSGERVDAISGGWTSYCLNVFYGGTVCNMYDRTADPAKDQNVAADNSDIIKWLCSYAQANKTGSNDVILTASVNTQKSIERLVAYAGILKEELQAYINAQGQNTQVDMEELQAAMKRIDNVERQANEYLNSDIIQGREGTSTVDQAKLRQNIDRDSIELEKNASFQSVAPASYQQFRTTLATVVSNELSDDKHGENIFIYSGHAYNISNVVFRDAKGNDLDASSSSDILKKADMDKSSLTLENPHGTTKASLHQVENRTGQGDFNVSLSDFFANVGIVELGYINK